MDNIAIGWIVFTGLVLLSGYTFHNKVKKFKKQHEEGRKKDADRISICNRNCRSAVSLY